MLSAEQQRAVQGRTYRLTLRNTELEVKVSTETCSLSGHSAARTSLCDCRCVMTLYEDMTEAPGYDDDIYAAPLQVRFRKLAATVRSFNSFTIETLSLYV